MPVGSDPIREECPHDYHLTTNTTRFTVDAPHAGMIVLTEAWLPDDFIATVNGRRTGYVRVNHAFKGVFVDQPGTYEVTFAYWPHHLTLSLILSALGALLTIAGAAYLWKSRPSSALSSGHDI